MNNNNPAGVRCARRFLWLFPLLALVHSAFAFEISQRHIVYDAAARSAAVHITNTSQAAREFSLRTHPWDDDTRGHAPDLIAYPPVFRLAPGEKQLVRLLLRDKDRYTPPLFFRLQVRSIDPVQEGARGPSQVVLPVSFSFPVYYVDLSVKPRAEVRLLRDEAGRSVGIWVQNTSETLLEITRLVTPGGQVIQVRRKILPGRAHVFRTEGLEGPFELRVARGDPIEVR